MPMGPGKYDELCTIARGEAMTKWPQYYVLVGQVPFAVDLETWARSCEDRYVELDRTGRDPYCVARTDINSRCFVSTVFLGLDHGFGRGDPLLFETMIFGGPIEEQWRYASWAQAERGHAKLVEMAKEAVEKVASIAESVGVKP
jgi:hypothetical protein